MKQSKLESFTEAITNTLIGFGINYMANLVIIPLVFHIELNLTQNFIAGLFFTVVSVIRSYALRRFFNSHVNWINKKIAHFISN